MTRHLCISITFLDPLFHGKGDSDEPEWPPSPMRLFQAMVAGSRAGFRDRDWSDAKGEAFRWLERREPPKIVTPAGRPAPSYTFYVPNNDSDKPKFDRVAKIARPHRLLDGQTMYYLWPISDAEWPSARPHAEVLCREARHVLALGWGIDQVVGNGRVLTDVEAAALSGRRWCAWNGHWPGRRLWRAPTEDALDDLQHVHESFRQRIQGKRYHPPLKPHRFKTITYLSAVVVPPRSYAVFELSEGVAFRQEAANKVAAMLRGLACRHAKADSHVFPGGPECYVAGHVNGQVETPPRFSYLPLPTIGHQHADGKIRRLMIAEPLGGDGSHAYWAQNRLRSQPLQDSDGNERGILLDLWRSTSRTMIHRYVDESRTWSTVTPVILPGHDDHDPKKKAPRLLLKAIEQAGLPLGAVEDFHLRKAPYWPGAQHPRQYQRPSYLQHLPAWHIWIRFREAITGPLAIGAGRHCGLGLFAAMDLHRTKSSVPSG